MRTPTGSSQPCFVAHPCDGIGEYAAAREAINERRIEAQEPIHAPLDLLAQHMITLALGVACRRGSEGNPYRMVVP